jgi:hypothetical protein
MIERQETLVQRPDFNQGLEGYCRRKAIHLPAFLPYSPAMSEYSSAPQRRRRRTKMQRGCLKRQTRKRGPDVWQFRWSEVSPDGKRLHHKKIVGTVDQYPEENAARRAVVGLVSEITTSARPMNSVAMTIPQLCDHFAQRELAKDNSWRSHRTKKIYQAYLTCWIRPHWQKYELADVRTIQVESWLRGLPLAKSNCAKVGP